MNSMTGFGRAAVVVGSRRLIVEVRAVNHRGLDVKVRGRDLDASSEIEIVKTVRAALERGAVVVGVHEEPTAGAGDLGVPVDRLRALHGALEAVRQELRLQSPIDLATMAAFLTASGGTGAALGDEPWPALKPAVESAIAALAAMRAREGRALAEDIHQRLRTLRALVGKLRVLCAALPARAARRLEDRIDALLGDGAPAELVPSRLAQEVALLAERLDVSEELVRLDAHLTHMETLAHVDGTAAVGRKMDFVIQEIGRELNTLGSKAQDADVAALVIDAKAELEKIREQAQNIE